MTWAQALLLFTMSGLAVAPQSSGITRAARRAVEAGGSLRDVQQLAGHSSLATTQRYIEGDTEAKRKLVNLI
jgi:integrase